MTKSINVTRWWSGVEERDDEIWGFFVVKWKFEAAEKWLKAMIKSFWRSFGLVMELSDVEQVETVTSGLVIWGFLRSWRD
jgi:hypothetical protein